MSSAHVSCAGRPLNLDLGKQDARYSVPGREDWECGALTGCLLGSPQLWWGARETAAVSREPHRLVVNTETAPSLREAALERSTAREMFSKEIPLFWNLWAHGCSNRVAASREPQEIVSQMYSWSGRPLARRVRELDPCFCRCVFAQSFVTLRLRPPLQRSTARDMSSRSLEPLLAAAVITLS